VSAARAATARRIVIVGTSGSGKTTLATTLAARRDLPHIELDALHWEADWIPAPPERFRASVMAAIAADRWVVDGGYSLVREVIWSRAEVLIWLDYPLPLLLWRLFWRACRRIRSREELWNSNRESFRMSFLSRDSLFIWAARTHHRRRRDYQRLLAAPAFADLMALRFRTPKATARWLAGQ
jgi:adenylate kinase family enzyme